MELSKKVIEYQRTKDETVFEDIYRIIHKGSKLVETYADKYKLDSLDVESMINEKLLTLTQMYDNKKGKFSNILNQSIRRGCIDLIRQKEYIEEHHTEVLIEDDEGEFSEIYEVLQVAPTTTEDDILNEVRKNRDQRQLITILMEKADEPTKLTISAFNNTNTYRQAATLVNTCHKTVKARIRKLSRYFNEETLGHYRDYFTVPTTKAG